MAAKSRFYRWRKELANVISRPGLLVSVIVIGLFTLWFASEQVRALFRFLVHLRLAETRYAERLLERYRYLLFGILIIVFVWLDLLVINILLSTARAVARWFHETFSETSVQIKKNHRPTTAKATRKNPMRSCRKSSSP